MRLPSAHQILTLTLVLSPLNNSKNQVHANVGFPKLGKILSRQGSIMFPKAINNDAYPYKNRLRLITSQGKDQLELILGKSISLRQTWLLESRPLVGEIV